MIASVFCWRACLVERELGVELHVYPQEARPHEMDYTCWCGAALLSDSGVGLMVKHRPWVMRGGVPDFLPGDVL